MVVLGRGLFLMSEVPLYPGMCLNDLALAARLKLQSIQGYLYKGTSLVRNRLLVGPYSSPVPRGLRWS